MNRQRTKWNKNSSKYSKQNSKPPSIMRPLAESNFQYEWLTQITHTFAQLNRRRKKYYVATYWFHFASSSIIKSCPHLWNNWFLYKIIGFLTIILCLPIHKRFYFALHVKNDFVHENETLSSVCNFLTTHQPNISVAIITLSFKPQSKYSLVCSLSWAIFVRFFQYENCCKVKMCGVRSRPRVTSQASFPF